MTKGLTDEQKAEIAKSALKTRTLVTISLDSETKRILVNDSVANLVIGGNTYNSRLVQMSNIDTSLDGTRERLIVNISDIDQEYANIISDSGDVLTNKDCKVEEVIFKDWTPAELTNLAAWYDASDTSTITEDNNVISQWADKSGNNKHGTQIYSAYKPTYDSINRSVNFNEDFLDVPNTSVQAAIIVCRNANGCAYYNWATPLIGNYGGDYVMLAVDTEHYTISVDGANNNTGDASINGGNLVPGNGTGKNISISGYVPFPTHNEADLVFFQTTNAHTYNLIANFFASGQSKIDIHEIILLSSTPSVDDRQKLEGYLASRWGIESKLPSGHPYKNTPQMVQIGDPILLFDGLINNVALSAESFTFTIERNLRSYATISPNIIYDVNCQFKFKDSRCRYPGAETKCDKTLTTCQGLDNVERFGGYPSLISQVVTIY